MRKKYALDWISIDGKGAKGPTTYHGMEFFPVMVAGAGRPTLSGSGDENFLSIGILHVPVGSSTLSSPVSGGTRLSTLTLLPPDPHLLLPLLLRAVEAEHRVLKKMAPSIENEKQAAAASRTVHLDESWRNELRGYLFRLPPYYQRAINRCLRIILPASAHSLLNTEDSLISQSCSKMCLQKIRAAECKVSFYL
jgi:integrator complex subunit 6